MIGVVCPYVRCSHVARQSIHRTVSRHLVSVDGIDGLGARVVLGDLFWQEVVQDATADVPKIQIRHFWPTISRSFTEIAISTTVLSGVLASCIANRYRFEWPLVLERILLAFCLPSLKNAVASGLCCLGSGYTDIINHNSY